MHPNIPAPALESAACIDPDELAQAYAKIDNLETALSTARRIGASVGIVMALYKLPYDAAFDMLVVASQHTHRKLHDVAEYVLETGDLRYGAWDAADHPRVRSAKSHH